MEQEDKELLLKDISARLSYGLKVCIKLPNHQEKIFEEHIGDLRELTIYGEYLVNSKGIDYRSFNLDIKPYLRPMSSMTEEEKKEFNSLINGVEERCINAYGKGGYTLAFIEVNDWLNKYHFDYRGLIEKGLAIKAPEGMYK